MLQKPAGKYCRNRPRKVRPEKFGRKSSAVKIAKIGQKNEWERYKIRSGKSCKIRPGKLYKVWPKSSAENCKRKQMQSISAMNSQSSIDRVQIDWNFGWENIAKFGREKLQKSAENLAKIGKNVTKIRTCLPQKMRCFNLIGMPPMIGTTLCAVVDWEASTFWWEASVDQDHVVCRCSNVDEVLSQQMTLWDASAVDWNHVVHVVVSTSIGSFNLFGRPPSVDQNLFTRASKTNDFFHESEQN